MLSGLDRHKFGQKMAKEESAGERGGKMCRIRRRMRTRHWFETYKTQCPQHDERGKTMPFFLQIQSNLTIPSVSGLRWTPRSKRSDKRCSFGRHYSLVGCHKTWQWSDKGLTVQSNSTGRHLLVFCFVALMSWFLDVSCQQISTAGSIGSMEDARQIQRPSSTH